MKRLLALILATLMCFFVTACKDNSTNDLKNTTTEKFSEEKVEHEIRVLMESNLDCYYMFYIAPLSHTTQQNSDGYYGTDESYLESYSKLSEIVYSTYTPQTAKKLLSYPNDTTPLYKDVDGKIFVKPDVITPVEYNILWDETYTLEFTETSDTKCTFKLTTTDLDSNPYETTGSAVNIDGEWVLEDLIY